MSCGSYMCVVWKSVGNRTRYTIKRSGIHAVCSVTLRISGVQATDTLGPAVHRDLLVWRDAQAQLPEIKVLSEQLQKAYEEMSDADFKAQEEAAAASAREAALQVCRFAPLIACAKPLPFIDVMACSVA